MRATAVAMGLAIGAAACPRSAPSAAAISVVSAPSDARARLPEDPDAGARSQAQWRVHLEAEERERQLGYDRRKLPEHRALIRALTAARARWEHARTEAAVARTTAAMPAIVADARRRLTALDHWGVNSRLLDDYRALLGALETDYSAAARAALTGHRGPRDALRASTDRRFEAMQAWLAKAAASEDE